MSRTHTYYATRFLVRMLFWIAVIAASGIALGLTLVALYD